MTATQTTRHVHIEKLESRNLLSAAVGTASSDVVIEWDQVLIAALRADRTLPGPGWASRSGAIMHAAIFDAVNSIDRSYEPYLVQARVPRSASIDAAVAGAGWRVLSSLYPQQSATFDAALARTLARVKDGPQEREGLAVGVFVADKILAARADDGSDVVVPYTPGTNMGDWQPTPPDFTPAWGPGWGDVHPFAIDSATQFPVPPPPALNSPEYAAAFNEVKSLGEKNSSMRTADQTQIGIFWGYDRSGMGAPPSMYNQMTTVIALQQHNSTVQNARLFALVNLAMADSGVAAWEAKFAYNFWRPINAMHDTRDDGNPATTPDPTWQPLGAPGGGVVDDFTPPFPAYVSGHATFGAAAAKSIADFYGRDDIHFTLASDEMPGITRSYHSLSQAAAENGASRIYLGIHWSFDNINGQALGRKIADFVFAHTLMPKGNHSAVGGSTLPPKVTFLALSKQPDDWL